VYSVLFYVFFGLYLLAAVGVALQFRDGGTLFGLASALFGLLILDYARQRKKFLSIYSYLKDHKGRLVLLMVVLFSYAISIWAFFAKGS
jgi:hypothetical protein